MAGCFCTSDLYLADLLILEFLLLGVLFHTLANIGIQNAKTWQCLFFCGYGTFAKN